MASTENLQYIPWLWMITPLDSATASCPGALHIILTYAATTVATTVAGLIFGCAPVARSLTCGRVGKRNSTSWTYTWISQVGLHAAAELLNAYLTVNAIGWDHDQMPKFWDLALFYTTRPRLGWIVLTMLGFCSPWHSVAKQTMILESITQLIGCYYFGRTAHFASQRGYYTHSHYNPNAQLVYAGALLTLITTLPAIITLLVTLRKLPRADDEKQRTRLAETCFAIFAVLLGMTAFIGRWCFLIGYVLLAGDAYCLPNLVVQAIVWVSLNVFGMFLGAGF